jgi:acetyl-CoA carboxylase carboxyl transferase subunit beta
MSILAWIEDQRKLKLLNAPKYKHPSSDGSKGLWTRCDHCGVILYIKHLKENQRVCFGCGYHLQMDSRERIEHLIDDATWRPLDETLSPCDPLEFKDQKLYTERLKDAQDRTGLQDAVQTGTGMLDGIPIALGVMDFHFMGGSMGSVVGEKITRLIEYAAQEGLTLILVCASGGARMQEGIFSLMQMAKISSALQIYQSCANLLYISVLTSPTTGGVTASFAMLGDLIFAEPKALIGFAGRRVIEQTLQEELPNDFQTSEYLLHHGLLDLIVPRCFLKQALSETITLYRDAPFKRPGNLPYGVQNRLYFLTEEKVRRKWQEWTSHKAINQSGSSQTESRQTGSAYQNQLLGTFNQNEEGTPVLPDPSTTPQSLDDCASLEKDSFAIGLEMESTPRLWLTDPLASTPYRDILASFQGMFGLLPHVSSDVADINQLTAAETMVLPVHLSEPVWRDSVQHQLQSHGGQPPQSSGAESAESLKSTMPLQEPKQRGRKQVTTELGGSISSLQTDFFTPLQDAKDLEDSFTDALALGIHENVSWRAFYTNQRTPLKLRLLEQLQLAKKPVEAEDVEKLQTRATSLASSDLRIVEKKFFYKMILNRSAVWKEGL